MTPFLCLLPSALYLLSSAFCPLPSAFCLKKPFALFLPFHSLILEAVRASAPSQMRSRRPAAGRLSKQPGAGPSASLSRKAKVWRGGEALVQRRVRGVYTQKSPGKRGLLGAWKGAVTYSPAFAVPSARRGLTSLFGMGRGGTPVLLPPESCSRSPAVAFAAARCRMR